MDIDKYSIGLDNLDYYDPDFRNVLEDHFSLLKTLASTKAVPVDGYLAVRYEFDFYGLMQQQNVPHQLHWLVMRLSGYTSPDQMSADLQSYYLPDPNYVESLRSVWSAKSGVK